MVERLRNTASLESKRKTTRRKKIRSFGQLAATVLATSENTHDNQYISPERHAFNDWFALQEANIRYKAILADIESKKENGEPEVISLQSDLSEAKGDLSHKMFVQRNHLIFFRKRYPNINDDPYNDTILTLHRFYSKHVRRERIKLLSNDPPSYFTQQQIEVSAMENVLSEFKTIYHKAHSDLSSKKAA